MAFSKIDPSVPSATDKIKFGDDCIREFKGQVIDNLRAVTNYNVNNVLPALKTAVWTTATRPQAGAQNQECDLVDRVSGYNRDLGCLEYYDEDSKVWNVIGTSVLTSAIVPQWTTTTRPTSIPTGYTGHCYDLDVFERWDGTTWKRVNSPNRGDIKYWYGNIDRISIENPGWVLANGQSVTVEGSIIAVPNLLNRVIVGAGANTGNGNYTPGNDGIGTGAYGCGDIGGEDKHKLVTNEMPSHRHSLRGANDSAGDSGGPDLGDSYDGGSTSTAVQPTGGDQPHENRQPYIALFPLYKL